MRTLLHMDLEKVLRNRMYHSQMSGSNTAYSVLVRIILSWTRHTSSVIFLCVVSRKLVLHGNKKYTSINVHAITDNAPNNIDHVIPGIGIDDKWLKFVDKTTRMNESPPYGLTLRIHHKSLSSLVDLVVNVIYCPTHVEYDRNKHWINSNCHGTSMYW